MPIGTPGGGGELVAIQSLAPGNKLRLRDGSLVDVHENPQDGMWLIVRYLKTADGADDDGRIDMVGADDVAARVLDGDAA